MSYSSQELAAMQIAAKCSATLSILGSSFIVWEILHKKQIFVSATTNNNNKNKNKNKTHDRQANKPQESWPEQGPHHHHPNDNRRSVLQNILLGLSINDIASSAGMFVGSWAIPQDTTGAAWEPHGSMTTCRMQGFFIQAGAVAVPLYNFGMALYYWLVVNHHYHQRDLQHKQIWLFHLPPVLFGLSTALYGLVADQYDNALLWCWFAGTDQSDILRFAIFYGPIWFSMLAAVALLVSVYQNVHRQEDRIHQDNIRRQAKNNDKAVKRQGSTGESSSAQSSYDEVDSCFVHEVEQDAIQGGQGAPAFESSDEKSDSVGRSSGDGGNSDNSNNPTTTLTLQRRISSTIIKAHKRKLQRKAAKYSRAVLWQGFWYFVAFILTFSFATIVRLKQTFQDTVPFTLVFLFTLSLPLQGFLNFLVYKRAEVARFMEFLKIELKAIFCSTNKSTSRKQQQQPQHCSAGALNVDGPAGNDVENGHYIPSILPPRGGDMSAFDELEEEHSRNTHSKHPDSGHDGYSEDDAEAYAGDEGKQSTDSSHSTHGDKVQRTSFLSTPKEPEQPGNHHQASAHHFRLSNLSWGGIGFSITGAADSIVEKKERVEQEEQDQQKGASISNQPQEQPPSNEPRRTPFLQREMVKDEVSPRGRKHDKKRNMLFGIGISKFSWGGLGETSTVVRENDEGNIKQAAP